MLFRRKSNTPKPNQSWPKWLFLGIVAYAVLANWGVRNPQMDEFNRSIGEIRKRAQRAQLLATEGYALRDVPGFQEGLRLKEVKFGAGEAVQCGQQVTLHYGMAVEPTEQPAAEEITRDKTATLRLGAGEQEMLEQAVLGMQPGGVRSTIVTGGMAQALQQAVAPEEQLRVEIVLDSLATPSPKTLPLKAYDDTVGSGPILLCGQTALLTLTMVNPDGSTRFTSEKLMELALGKAQEAVGLEQGIIGMQPGGERTLLLWPGWQKPLDNAAKSALPWPNDRLVVAEVKLMEIR